MREIDGIVYYTSGDVSAYITRSRQTTVALDVLSDFWEKEHWGKVCTEAHQSQWSTPLHKGPSSGNKEIYRYKERRRTCQG